MRMPILLVLALARLATPQGGTADPSAAVQEALTKLRSADLRTIAWGAWSVADNKLAACAAELQTQLSTLARLAPSKCELAVGSILDALIEIEAKVSVEQLEPFLDRRGLRAQVMVLLVRCGDENRAALRRLFRAEDHRSLVWAACGNLLAKARDPEFLLDLLRYPVHLRVSVVDEGLVPERPRLRTTNFGYQDIGYPPIATWRLGCQGILISDAPLEVRAGRKVHTSQLSAKARIGWAEEEWVSDYLHLVRMWMADWLRDRAPDRLLDHDQWVSIEWSGGDAFLAAVRERREEIERDHRALVDACVVAKLVTLAAATDCVPLVEVEVDDQRKDRSTPLPPVPDPRPTQSR